MQVEYKGTTPPRPNNCGQTERQGLLESYRIPDPVDLNAAADRERIVRGGTAASSNRTNHPALHRTGALGSGHRRFPAGCWGSLRWCCRCGFERMAPASASDWPCCLAVLTGTGKARACRVVVAAMAIRHRPIPVRLRSALTARVHPGRPWTGHPAGEPPSKSTSPVAPGGRDFGFREEDGWRRVHRYRGDHDQLALASCPFDSDRREPDPRSVSAQWAPPAWSEDPPSSRPTSYAPSAGWSCPAAALDRRREQLGPGESALDPVVQSGTRRSKPGADRNKRRDDTPGQLARRLPAEAEFALRLSPGAAAVPWDSVVPGVVGVATVLRGEGTRVLLSRTPVAAAQLDSMAARAIPQTTRIIGLAPPGATLDRIGLEVANPQRPGAGAHCRAGGQRTEDAFALAGGDAPAPGPGADPPAAQ
jgi:hypothetical protein